MAEPYDLFVDDERSPPLQTSRQLPKNWVVAKTMREAQDIIESRGVPRFLSLDYNLGWFEPTGLDFVKWFIEWCRQHGNPWFDFHCQSADFEGKKKIEMCVFDYWLEISA